eukprot:765838-Hanusia_phi.AAC.8
MAPQSQGGGRAGRQAEGRKEGRKEERETMARESRGRRIHIRLPTEILPVVVYVAEVHSRWYDEERHRTIVSLIPEVLEQILPNTNFDKKKLDATRVKEDVFRGVGMELRCFFRSTLPTYHVLSTDAQDEPLASSTSAWTLHGLPASMHGEDLQDLFDRFGQISWTATIPVPHNSSVSYGYVQYEDATNALEAQRQMHGRALPTPHQQVTLFVDFAEDGVVPPSLRLWSRLQHVKRELTLHRRTEPLAHRPVEDPGTSSISSSLLEFLNNLKPRQKTSTNWMSNTRHQGAKNPRLRERNRRQDKK